MSRTAHLRTLAGSLAVVSLLAVPAGADARMTKGLQDNLILSDDAGDRAAFFADAKSSHATTVRVLVKWDGKSAGAPADQIARIRRAAEEGRAAHVRLLVGSYVTLGRGRRAGAKVPARTQSRYVQFMGDVAEQLSDLPLAGYLTYNEPNYRTAWPTHREHEWVRLSNRVYTAIKRADRGAKVLVGEAAPNTRSGDAATNPGAFFRKALYLDTNYRPTSRSKAARTKLLGDGFTLHTYDFVRSPTKRTTATDQWTHGNLKTTVAQIKRLARAGRLSSTAARNIHITEFAYRTAGGYRTPETRAASYLRSAFSSAKRAGIKTFIWYQLRDPKGRSDWKSGLKTSSGKARKTWTVFRRLR
jgi:hypothetical protein